MKKTTAKWVRKAEEDWETAQNLAAQKKPHRDAVCFPYQQSAEKYVKALYGLASMLETPAVNVLLAGVEKRPEQHVARNA